MSARESNLREAGGLGPRSGKCTRDGSQPSVGEATQPTPVFPHLRYGDAVHAALTASGLSPDVMDAGVRTEEQGAQRELFLTVSWLRENPDLQDPVGLDLFWSHLTGWGARIGDDVVLLDVHELATPELLVDAARHLTEHRMARDWLPPFHALWEGAGPLNTALDHFDEQGVTW